MREQLKDLDIGRLEIEDERETPDGTVKMLLRLTGAARRRGFEFR